MMITVCQSAILFLGVFVLVVNSARGPLPVRINKCCRIGEKLEQHLNDSSTELPSCLVGGSEFWFPKIYMLQRKTIFEPIGRAPQHMSVAEATFPKCKHPQVYADKTNMFLTSQGDLTILSEDRKVSKENYCVDKDIALVCRDLEETLSGDPAEAKKLTKVNKCCGPDGQYQPLKLSCEKLPLGHKMIGTKFIDSPSVSIIYGFPKCENDDFAIAGKFNFNDFEQATGVLTLDSGKHLQTTQYCLEYVPDETVNVFSCSHHFTSPPVIAPVEKHVS